MSVSGLDICKAAMLEHNIFQLGTDPAPEDADFVLGKCNRILDNWNAERTTVCCETILQFALIASTNPITIGPSGMFGVTQRPVTIDAASVFVTTTVKQPIDCDHDYRWWSRQSVPGQTSTFPTDLYYEPDWPNGKLFFWPVGTGNQTIELVTRTLLAALTLSGQVTLAPGYQDALTLTLAENIASAYRRPVTPELKDAAREARARAFGNNLIIPNLETQDSGMPQSGPSTMNYLTRQVR